MAYVDGYGLSEITFEAYAKASELVDVTLAYAVSSEKIRVKFSRGMTINSDLTSKYNYEITTATSGAVVPYINSVEYENVANPTYIDLIISETTNGATYTIEVNPDGPVDLYGEPVDPDNNSQSCVGIGIHPIVSSVIAISKNRVDVVFSEYMLDNSDIRDPDNYTFDNGLTTLSVLDVDGDTVKLVTSDQTEGLIYTLTVNPSVYIVPVITSISGTDIVSNEQDVVISGDGFLDSGVIEACDNSNYDLSTIKVTQSQDSYSNETIQIDLNLATFFS